MVEFTPLEVSAWIKKLGPSFKDALIPLGLSSISSYQREQTFSMCIHWVLDPYLACLLIQFVEIYPILKELSAIMGEPNITTLILPTTDEDFFDLAH